MAAGFGDYGPDYAICPGCGGPVFRHGGSCTDHTCRYSPAYKKSTPSGGGTGTPKTKSGGGFVSNVLGILFIIALLAFIFGGK